MAERTVALRELDRINRLCQFTHPFVSRLPAWLGQPRCERLEILDVGAGSGLLGERLSAWAKRRGWDWRFTNLDAHPIGRASAGTVRNVTGSALELPFADGSFDLVVASQMTHHLTDAEVVRHWREAWRVTRDGIFNGASWRRGRTSRTPKCGFTTVRASACRRGRKSPEPVASKASARCR